MQPILNLLNGELATTDTATGRAALRADAAPSLFADVLGPRMPAPPEPPSPAGNLLPQSGNNLPGGQPTLNILGESEGVIQSAIQNGIENGIRSDVQRSLSVDPEQIIASLQQQLSALQDSTAAVPIDGIAPSAAVLESADNVDAAEAVDPMLLDPSATDTVAQLVAVPVLVPVATQTPVAAVATNTPGPMARRPLQNVELLSERVSVGLDGLARDLRPDRASTDAMRSTLELADSVQKPLVQTPTPTPSVKAAEQPVVGIALEDPLSKPTFAASAGTSQVAPDIALLPLAPPARVAAEALPTSPLPTTTLHAAVREPGWGDAFSQKITLMANNKLQAAEIRLTPADLGPLRVRLTIEEGAVSIAFIAQHAVTREAIEQALPRLREMLAENGLNLERASVGEEGVAEGHRDDDRHAQATADAHLSDESESEIPPDMGNQADRLRTRDGLVDTFV